MGDKAPRLCIITTGAGAGIQQQIWAVPGISNFFVGAYMPYDTKETARILGFTPTKWVSNETAVDLAQAAYLLAYKPGRRALGVGVTCSATSTRKHRGDHRIVVAAFTENACYIINLVIPKGDFWDEDREKAGLKPLEPEVLATRIEAQRLKDGKLTDELALYLIGVLVGGVQPNNFQDLCELLMNEPLPDIKIVSSMELARERVLVHPFFKANGRRGTLEDIVPMETTFYPGAFNPPHEGHFGAGKAAMRMSTGRSLVFSTTVNSPHKAPLDAAEMLQRAALMHGYDFLLTEGDGLYLDKAKCFPGAHIIMGADALDRMLDPKWGINSADLIRELAQLGTKILVSGRLVGDVFMTCDEVLRKRNIYSSTSEGEFYLGNIFVGVDYRMDLSSTELRLNR